MTDSEAQAIQRQLGAFDQRFAGVEKSMDRIERFMDEHNKLHATEAEHNGKLKQEVMELGKGIQVLFTKTDRLEDSSATISAKVAGISAIIAAAAGWLSNHFKIGG